MQPDESRQFPIGRWQCPDHLTAAELADRITQLRELPRQYRALTESLDDDALARLYRPGSWTIRQLVNHVADTHQWHYFRIKHALTIPETVTGIASSMNDWAVLPDGQNSPVGPSMAILEGVHDRLAYLFDHLTEADLQKAYFHQGRQLTVTLPQAIDMVVWHGQHHLAHIRLAMGL